MFIFGFMIHAQFITEYIKSIEIIILEAILL